MRLRECRERAKLSQKYVALTLGVAAPSVSNWESGKTKPSRENMMKLADLYGVTIDYLAGRTDSPDEIQTEHEKTAGAISYPRTTEARILSAGVDKMPARDRDKLLNMVRVVFDQYADFFEEGNDDDDPES